MVCVGLGEDRGRVSQSKSMAMVPERSKPLHNFDLPWLKWGNQRQLRCMKVSADSDAGGGGSDSSNNGGRRSPVIRSENLAATRKRELESKADKNGRYSEKKVRSNNPKLKIEDGIEAVRKKLMFDLRTAADEMKDKILRKEMVGQDEEEEGDRESSPPAVAASEVVPWNLRTRKAAGKASIGGEGGKGLNTEEKKKANCSPLMTENGVKSPRLKNTSPERKERLKFSVALSKTEVEEDFMGIVGHRPPRRPKKRPRTVQRQLDSLFPGLWLTEVTADLYKVSAAPDNGKDEQAWQSSSSLVLL